MELTITVQKKRLTLVMKSYNLTTISTILPFLNLWKESVE